jgi:Flp pilus assembly protein protease CpaA
MTANVILWSTLWIWLLVCMIFDLRTRQVPAKLTIIPLAAAGGYALFQQAWTPVILAVSLIFISDFEPRSRRLAFAVSVALFMAIFDPTRLVHVVALFTIWLLWEIGSMGGADAKLLMVIALVIGQPVVFLFIGLAGGVQGLTGLVLRRKEIPYIVAIFAGSSLYVLNTLVFKIL